MSNKKRLVWSIREFMLDQLNSESLSSDSKESIEVAIQCLEAAFEVNPMDGSLQTNKKLENIFDDYLKDGQNTSGVRPQIPVTEEQRTEAERLKNEGNELMKSEKFTEALSLYGRAIQLDASNAVYYCNRAAALSKLNNHEMALEDCRRAISYDPNYSKAYGRMGLAFGNLNDHQRSRDCYRKAVELDPNNESYRNNLKIAEEKVAEQTPQLGNPFDLSSLLSNPALMNMATQLMTDPNMQNLMGGLMSGAMSNNPQDSAQADIGVGANVGNVGASSGAPTGIEALLQAGQQIAAQMQASNPDLVNQLRNVMGGQTDNPDQNESNPNNQNPDGSGDNK